MFKRPAYISILVGFLSLFCAGMILFCLRIVFVSTDPGDFDSAVAPPAPVATAAAADEATSDSSPVPKTVPPFVMLAYAILTFVCTVNMLDGANWARWLYTVAWVLLLIFNFSIYDWPHFLHRALAFAIIYGFVIPFLFLPAANDFFKSPH